MRGDAATADADAIAAAAARASADAPFLRRLLARRPEVVRRLAETGLEATLTAARMEEADDADVGRALRRERQAVALAVALADLAGLSLERVTRALSDFADQALNRAIIAAVAERAPGAEPIGFVALALGKQGSRELNYSSDIDPILLYDPVTLPRRARDEPGEAAVRIAQRVVALLQQTTAEGHVLRVDLRLRPASEATPLAVPVEAAALHYESSALAWERAAFIRARPAAGDVALGVAFLARIRPFIWRRALDFGAVEELRALSRRIRGHYGGQRLAPGYDVKRGRGGIREIEFFAQIHQLIHGGREPALRAPATLDALAALAESGRIDGEEAADLARAYRLLRTVEHRLQMVEDRQTHRLPEEQAALDGVARLAGQADGAALLAQLRPHVERAGSLYDGLDDDGGRRHLPAGAALSEELARGGFADPRAAAARIAGWRDGRWPATRGAAARAAIETILPRLVSALSASVMPDVALARFDDLVSKVPTALNLFRLLEARPQLNGLTLRLLAHAPALAADLARRPMLLDGLIDASALRPAPPVNALAEAFARGEAGEDYQGLLDRVRAEVGERRFALGAQLLAAAADPIEVGRGYGRVAEAAVAVLAGATVATFAAAHGRVPGSELLVLALGRLGGGVLTHASDLDLVFLFTGDFLDESDGVKQLGATTYYNRLAQRVIAALSVPTASGPLYPVDTRLRPSGGQGLLAVSLDSFARYQAEKAWTWEHMALTRARPVFGSEDARTAMADVIAATLNAPRDPAELAARAVRMRGEIARHKPPAGPCDVKLIEGGLVDAEFAIQLLQLRERVGLDPDLGRAASLLEEAGLLGEGFAAALALLTRLLIVLRLVAPEGGAPAEPSRALVAEACRVVNWAALDRAYADARRLIAAEWRRIAGLG